MRTSSTQTSAPRGGSLSFKKEDGKHYLKIQKDCPGYSSPLMSYLDTPSHTDPSQPMYKIVADGENGSKDRAITGHAAMVMLECSQEDYEAEMKRATDEAKFLEERVDKDEKFEKGGPISI